MINYKSGGGKNKTNRKQHEREDSCAILFVGKGVSVVVCVCILGGGAWICRGLLDGGMVNGLNFQGVIPQKV